MDFLYVINIMSVTTLGLMSIDVVLCTIWMDITSMSVLFCLSNRFDVFERII